MKNSLILRFIKSIYFEIIFILIGLVILFSLAFIISSDYAREEARENKLVFDRAVLILEEKINSYLHALQGIGGLYLVKDFKITHAELRKYVEFRDFFINFPGSLGFGFIRQVPKYDLDNYLKNIKQNSPNFKLRHLEHNPINDHMIIESIEPVEYNQTAQGLDIASEPKRRNAAIRAMETGSLSLTSTIKLVQLGGKEDGFLLLLPVYQKSIQPKTIEERRNSIRGWAYTPITLKNLTEIYFSMTNNQFGLNLIDITNPETPEILFQNIRNDREVFEKSIFIGGRIWALKGQNIKKSTPLDQIIIIAFFIVLGSVHIYAVLKVKRILLMNEENSIRARTAEKLKSLLMDHSHMSVISTLPNGIIATFNATAEKMLGYKATELIGKTTPAIIHLESEVVERSKLISQELKRNIEPGFRTFVEKADVNGQDTNEWTYVAKNKQHIPVRLTVTQIKNNENELIGYLGIAEDISAQKEMEKVIENQKVQLVQNAKMKSLGEMAGGVAHEINTPLTIIINKTRSIISMIESPNFDQTKIIADLKKIDATSFKIAKIINGLRTFSRQSDHDPMTRLNLSTVINDTLELCHERLKYEQVELRREGNFDLSFAGKSSQISQVLLNLIGNSLDAVEKLNEKWVLIKVIDFENTFQVRIIDSGTGISQEAQARLMQPFFTTKEIGKGTGLGLSIAKGIIENHNGRFYYDNNASNTTFVIDLPKA